MEGVTDNNAGVHKLSLLPPSPIDKNTPGKSNNEPQSSSQSDGHYFHSLNFITIIFYSVDQFIKDVIFDTCVCVCVCVCVFGLYHSLVPQETWSASNVDG